MGIWATIFTSASVCEPEPKGRILNYDRNGRIFLLPPAKRRTGARQVNILSELHVGESAFLVALDLPDSVQNHLMHMGFVPDAFVTALRRAPAGDPTVYLVDGMEIALRRETAGAIRVRTSDAEGSNHREPFQLVEAGQ
jgi:Fe2+ transport system protein FeoA